MGIYLQLCISKFHSSSERSKWHFVFIYLHEFKTFVDEKGVLRKVTSQGDLILNS